MKGWKTKKSDARKQAIAVHESTHAVAHVLLLEDAEHRLTRVSMHVAIFVNGQQVDPPEADYRRIALCLNPEKLMRMLQSPSFKWLKPGHSISVENAVCGREFDAPPPDLEKYAIYAFGATICEDMYTGNTTDIFDPNGSASTDMHDFLYWASQVGLKVEQSMELLCRVLPTAEKFVREHWSEIVAVANALLLKEELTGSEVKEILSAQAQTVGAAINESQTGAANDPA